MNYFDKIISMLEELLDLDNPGQITPETYLIRDLDAESIDLLELAISLNTEFKIEIKDNAVFLFDLRLFMDEALEQSQEPVTYLQSKLPHLSRERITHMVEDLESGPVLKIKDIISYLEYKSRR